MVIAKQMSATAFRERFIDFRELNHQRRALALYGAVGTNSVVLRPWQAALDSLTACYPHVHERVLVGRVLADPYFPLSMLRKLYVEEFPKEPKFANFGEESLAKITAEHLISWAEIFLHIRQDLAILNANSQVSSMKLTGSPEECLPDSSWCDYCGGCCEIRGGPPEFTQALEPPERWRLYFRGDGCTHQRFCPFLFEYFASGKFFCSIYWVKPECCWVFDRDECEFLQKDVARERAAHLRLGDARS